MSLPTMLSTRPTRTVNRCRHQRHRPWKFVPVWRRKPWRSLTSWRCCSSFSFGRQLPLFSCRAWCLLGMRRACVPATARNGLRCLCHTSTTCTCRTSLLSCHQDLVGPMSLDGLPFPDSLALSSRLCHPLTSCWRPSYPIQMRLSN